MQHLAIDLHAPLGDPALGVAARAEAGAGQPLGDALAWLGGLVHLGHWRRAPRKASNKRASPSEIRNSGCHCTPMQKR